MVFTWALPRSDMFVFYRTDLRQLFICGAYFWIGVLIHQWRLPARQSSPVLLGVLAVWRCPVAMAKPVCFYVLSGIATAHHRCGRTVLARLLVIEYA